MSDEIYTGGLGALSMIAPTPGARISYLAQRMGYRVDQRFYEGLGAATPSTIEIDVARGRGPYICTQLAIYLSSSGPDHRLDISRGATSFFDGKVPATYFSSLNQIDYGLGSLFNGNAMLKHAPFVLDEDTLSVFAEPYSYGNPAASWSLQLSGFHTDAKFAEYVKRKLGEFGGVSVDLGAFVGQPMTRTLNLSRPLTVANIWATTQTDSVSYPGVSPNSALEIRRNTLSLFNRGFQFALVGTQAVTDLNTGADSLAHSAQTKDLYEFNTQAVSGLTNCQTNVTMLGARVYTR